MKNNKLILLAVVTLIVIVVASMIVQSRAPQTEKEKLLFFPELKTQIDQVARIEIKGYDDSITLERQGNLWVIREFDGYPALLEKIKSTVIGVSELRMVAPKTASSRLYHRLGVQGHTIENSPSLLLTLKDGNNQSLAELIIGSPRKSRAAENKPGLYIRKPDSEQSWLVEGLLDISSMKTDWFERTLFDITSANISRIEVIHSDSANYTVFKSDRGQDDFELEPVPAGKKATSVIILNKFGSLLQDFHSSGVRSQNTINEPENYIDARVSTFEGLVTNIHAFLVDDIAHATFSFDFDDSVLSAEAERNDQLNADDFRELVQNLNSKLSGWIFEIPEFKYEVLERTLAELLLDTSIEDELDDF